MILILGGAFQGKIDFTIKEFNIASEDIFDCEIDNLSEFSNKKLIKGLNFLVKRFLINNESPFKILEMLDDDKIITSDEVGMGIVPIEKLDRDYREESARLLCQVALRSHKVIRVFAGIPTVIKDIKRFYFIRHGKTSGNLKRVFLGKTDEALCPEGRVEIEKYAKNGFYPMVDKVFSSPLVRCKETAELIYNKKKIIEIVSIAECDFGIFEGKTHSEIIREKGFENWGMTKKSMIFPEGEDIDKFNNRCILGFEEIKEIVKNENLFNIAIICHGGTIMAINELILNKSLEGITENGNGIFIEHDFLNNKTIFKRRIF